MFDNLKKSVAKPSSSNVAQRAGRELPRTSAFVKALADNNLRLSYAALADAAAALGEHTPSGLSAGQRGAALLSGLPISLQPFVCNATGGYRKGMEWADQEITTADLRKMGYVRPEAVHQFVAQFIKATSKPAPAATPEATADEVIEGEAADSEI